MLTKAGVNTRWADFQGNTILLEQVILGNEDVSELQLLLAAGISADQANIHGVTPLSLACACDFDDSVKQLFLRHSNLALLSS